MSQNDSSSLPCPLSVLGVLFQHDYRLLTIRELGRLSTVSKGTAGAIEDALVWKKIYEEVKENDPFTTVDSWPLVREFRDTEHQFLSWSGEEGLLQCFSVPSPEVLERVGYKRAAGCLLGKSCKICGVMTARANPLSFERFCKSCDRDNVTSYIIGKSKAKDAFLLSESDVRMLPNASFRSKNPINDRPCTTTLFLMSDVKNAAFAKYGGADGLAAEFGRREVKAMEKYNQSQSTDKPQKKRPKVTKMSHRPADDLKSLSTSCVLIGTAVPAMNGQPKRVYFSAKCKFAPQCSCEGNIFDILLHERLQHGVDVYADDDMFEAVPQETESPNDLSYVGDVPGTPEALAHLISAAVLDYSRAEGEGRYIVAAGGFPFFIPIDVREVQYSFNKTYCIITPRQLDEQSPVIKIAVDRCEARDCDGDNFGGTTICWQNGSKTVPVKLLKVVFGENAGQYACQATQEKLIDFIEALGLDKAVTNPAQVLVMLLSRVMTIEEVSSAINSSSAHHRGAFPVLEAMKDVLEEVG